MSDFDNIPAVDDSFLCWAGRGTVEEEEEEEEEKEEDAANVECEGKYRFNGNHICMALSNSTIDSKNEF